MPDPRKLLRSKSGNNFLTGKFAERILKWLVPLGNIRVFGEDGTEYKVDYSDTSVFITLKAITGSPTESVAGTYRGVWGGGEALFQERWAVTSGPYAGMYVCVNPDGTSRNPWEGVDWHREPSPVGQIGNWT